MGPTDEIVNRTQMQLRETLMEMANALNFQQHTRALGHLTDAHLIFSTGLREIVDIVAQNEPQDIAIEIADEKLSGANNILNGMSDMMAHYIDGAVEQAVRATEAADFAMRLLSRDQNYRENPGW